MAKVHRRRLGFSDPFTPEQFESFRIVFTDCAKRVHADPEALFESTWPVIQAAASCCDQQLAIQRHQNEKEPDKARALFLTDDGFVWAVVDNPPDRCRSRIRTRKRNRFRALREAAKRGDVEWLLRTHPEDTDALLYGAIRAGVADDYDNLPTLSPADLQEAIAAALAPDSILKDVGGRPTGTPIDVYARFLARVYRGIRGTKTVSTQYDFVTGERRGPAIRFFQAALAPFSLGLSTHGLDKLIERASRIC